MIWKMHPPEEIDAGCPCFYKNLVRMQGQLQSRFQKSRYFREKVFQIFSALVQNDEIVRVPYAMCDFHVPFQKMVELVHVNVHQKLAGEIAQRQADVRPVFGVETSDNFAQKQDHISAPDVFLQNIAQNFMIDIGEEFSDVALQNPSGPGVIPRNFASVVAEAVYGAVRAF